MSVTESRPASLSWEIAAFNRGQLQDRSPLTAHREVPGTSPGASLCFLGCVFSVPTLEPSAASSQAGFGPQSPAVSSIAGSMPQAPTNSNIRLEGFHQVNGGASIDYFRGGTNWRRVGNTQSMRVIGRTDALTTASNGLAIRFGLPNGR